LLRAGRFDISNMKPGDSRKVTFSFDVSPGLAEPEAVIALSVGDRDINEFATEKVKVPIEPASPVAELNATRQAGPKGALLLEGPKDGARGFGKIAAGTAVAVIGRAGAFDKVRVESGRFAFVASSDLADGGTKPGTTLSFDDVYAHAPPELKFEAAALATKSATVKIRGTAIGTEKLLDLYGFVGNRKVFYQSNKNGKDAKSASFEVDMPLRPGVNILNVVARETPDSTTRRVIVVRRDAENGALLKTPKTQESVEDWLAPPTPSD
jgi:carboxyl-terminal processing protease